MVERLRTGLHAAYEGLGKSRGLSAVALIQVLLLFPLAYFKPEIDWRAFGWALLGINGPYYGGAGWKAYSKFKNGGSASK